MIPRQNKLSQTSEDGKGENAGTNQTVHHDGVTSEVDRFSSEPARSNSSGSSVLVTGEEDNGETLFFSQRGGNQSLSQGNMGDYFLDTKTIVRWLTADQSTLLHESGHFYLDMLTDVSRNLSEKQI